MYTDEQRIKAVKLYIKYGRSAAATVRELRYPSKKNLRRWHTIYIRTGRLPYTLRKWLLEIEPGHRFHLLTQPATPTAAARQSGHHP